jgi:AraC-like DNA-binding protein
MIYASEADIVPLIRNLINALQPYALANQVSLTFTSNENVLPIVHEPYSLIQSLSHLICQIINLIPHESKIEVRLRSLAQEGNLFIEIENTGINLKPVSNIITAYHFGCDALQNGTLYKLLLSLNHQLAIKTQNNYTVPAHNHLPQFYAEMRKRLQSHFTQAEKLVAALSQTRPMEASFLQKINTLIKANLHDECFDTQAICKAMAMSRTQLFRRLKPLIRQAPATYIKTMRLQLAKELLETTELTVSEVAYKSGFPTASHFTKVFQQQYGLLPSHFRRNRNATNE